MIKTKNIMHSASNRKYTQLSKEGLPLWLYYASRREGNTAGCSPATPINPANISNNNLYAGLTSPAMQLDKKTLVITAETLKNIKHRPILDYLYFCKFSFILWGYDKNKSESKPGRLAISSSVLNSSQAITPSTKITPANPSSSFDFPYASELFSALEKMKNGGIILPKLTQQQHITHCIGGKTKEDEFRRWIFFPDQADAIDQCELAIALPLNLDPNEVISRTNLEKNQWNHFPEIESIKQCMLGVYQSWQENNISCEQRVREIISLLKNNFKQDLFYGSTDCHAYLIAKCSDGKYRRINLGGSDNYTEEYLPVEKKIC